jgi:hypothetical protein
MKKNYYSIFKEGSGDFMDILKLKWVNVVQSLLENI